MEDISNIINQWVWEVVSIFLRENDDHYTRCNIVKTENIYYVVI